MPLYAPKAKQRLSNVIVIVTLRFSLLFDTQSNNEEITWSSIGYYSLTHLSSTLSRKTKGLRMEKLVVFGEFATNFSPCCLAVE